MDAKWYADWIRQLPAESAEMKLRNLEAADCLEKLDAENAVLKNSVSRWFYPKYCYNCGLELQANEV